MLKKIFELKNYYKKYKELVNYIIVGSLTTLISLATYYICVLTFLNPKIKTELQFANIISWIFGVIFAYITNRKYVFYSKEKNIFKESLMFFLSRGTTLIVDMLTMFLLVSICNVNDKISKIISCIIVTVLNYIISKLIVFSKKKNRKT